MQENKIDIQALLHLLKRRKWFLIIPLILACIGGYIRIITLVSEYRSTVTILLGKNPHFTRNMEAVLPDIEAREKLKMKDQIETLTKEFRSNALLTKVVDNLGLQPTQGQIEKARKLISSQTGVTLDEAVRSVMAASLRNKIKLEFPKRGDYIEVSVVSKDPEEAYLIAKHAAGTFIEEKLLEEQLGVQGTLEFSSSQLSIYKEQLEAAEDRLRQFQANIASNASNEEIPINPENVSHVKGLIASYSVQISDLLKEVSMLDSRLGRYASEIHIRKTNRATQLRADLINKISDLSKLMISRPWNSGDVLRLNREIADLREELTEEIRTGGARHLAGVFSARDISAAIRKEIVESEVDLLKVQKSTLGRFLEAYSSHTNRLPVHEVTQQKLQMDIDKSRELYQTFLDQVRSAQIRTALQKVDKDLRYKIINPAQLPTNPINAGTNQVIIIALVLGLGVGSGFIYLLEFIDQSFKSVEEVENYIGLVVLGTVPKIDFEERMNKNKKKKLSFF